MITLIEYQNKAANILKITREQSGKTQKEVADLIGVTRQTINNWECGYTFPDFPLVLKWFDILNLKIDDSFFSNFNDDEVLEHIKNQASAIVDVIENHMKGIKK